MDHGKLTDHNGKQIDFRNVILIMTTNAGAADMARAAFGFTRNKREGDDLEAINKMFTPEFRNRLDSIVTFGHLPISVISKVVDKFILQLEAQHADRNVTIERVGVTAAEAGPKNVAFVFPDGPVTPRPERDIVEAGRKRKARSDAAAEAEQEVDPVDEDESDGPEAEGDGGTGSSGPKVPLKT